MNDGQIDLLTAILVSLFGIVNVLITVIISPIINEKRNSITYKKEKLYEASVELVDYTADIMGAKKLKQEIFPE